MKKKAAIIIERMDTALGGAERSISELAEALRQRGIEVTILTATGQTQSPNTCVLFEDKSGKRTDFHTLAIALKEHLAKNHYDIIHSVLPFEFADVYQPRGGSFAEAALRNAESYQNTFLSFFKKVTAFANVRRTVLLNAERRLCENTNGPVIAALSDYVAEQFKRHYGVDPQRLAIIRNGVKTDKPIDHTKVEILRTKLSKEFKETENHTLFLFAANNFRLKGLACLINAIQAATDNACLIVVGRDNAFKYHHMAGKIDNRIIFLEQIEGIQNILAIADVAILPTFYDPSSRFILEALAAGKPVITTKFNGAADLFTQHRHGIVIDSPQNIPELTQAINYFSQPQNIEKASHAITTDNLREKISITRVAQEMEALYTTIIDRRRTR